MRNVDDGGENGKSGKMMSFMVATNAFRGRSFMTSLFFWPFWIPPSPRQKMTYFYGPHPLPISMCQIFMTPPFD